MRLANCAGRAAILIDDGIADVASVSGGRFGPEPMSVFAEWDAFRAFVPSVDGPTGPLDPATLANPSPTPRQVFGIGLNYRAHAAESGRPLPEMPATFTKFPTSLAGPFDEIDLVASSVDWEVELVVVIGRRAHHVGRADGWDHVAGLTIGQDISDRQLQFAAGGQFSLGKSRPGYAPMGPWLVTPDELDDPDDIALGCAIDGEIVQDARTSDLIFDVCDLIEQLSAVVPLLPGDVIFTGTPAGVGVARTPPRALRPGQVVESWADGIGRMSNLCR